MGGRGRLIPSTCGEDGQEYRLHRLFVEGHNLGGEESENPSENTPHHTALVSLITAITGENGGAPSGLQVQKLNDWLNAIEVQFVDDTNIDTAVKGLV